jgi:uncharacterized membrane-anchored protein
MSKIWNNIERLIENGDILISEHGYDEIAADGLIAREIVAGSVESIVLEEYPDYSKGPCVLIMMKDHDERS